MKKFSDFKALKVDSMVRLQSQKFNSTSEVTLINTKITLKNKVEGNSFAI